MKPGWFVEYKGLFGFVEYVNKDRAGVRLFSGSVIDDKQSNFNVVIRKD